MSDVRSLFGVNFNRNNNTTASYLLAQIGGSVYEVSANQIQNLNINSEYTLPVTDLGTEDSDFVVFNDYIYHVNGRGPNASLNLQETNPKWTDKNISPTPRAKYIESYRERLYLGYLRMKFVDDAFIFPITDAQYLFDNPVFKKRVWYSDLPDGDNLTWGFGYGNIGSVSYDGLGQLTRIPVNQTLYTKPGHWFRSNNIKIGDPVYIGQNGKWHQFFVSEIESEFALKIIPKVSNIDVPTANNMWVGSNWFDVPLDGDDYITQLEQNKELDSLLIFGRNALFRYNESSLKSVSNIGTTSPKSVKTIKGLTMYFHGSDREKTGFYLWNGVREKKVSNRVQPFIDAISSANYTNIVAWQDGNKYRAYCGNMSSTPSSLNQFDISLNNAVFTYDLENDAQSVDTVGDVIRSSTTFSENGVFKTYLGNDSNEVLEVDESYSYNGKDITMKASTGPIFVRGTQVVNQFTRIQVISRDAGGVSVKYKLWYKAFDIDQKWMSLGNLEDPRVEIPIPYDNSEGVGIELMFEESSSDQKTPVIEQVTIYSRPIRTKLPEITSR